MSSSQNQRPRFFQDQYLGAEDLSAAVDYSRIQMARHVLGAHSWGIATGLQLKEKKLAGGRIEIYVLPGYAWDGFGRPITLLAPYKIPTELFKPYVFNAAIDNAKPEGRLIKVWLRYDESLTQSARPGFEVCDIEGQNSRVQETFRVEVGERSNHIDQHDHIMVAGNSIDAQEVIQKFDSPGLTPPVSLFDESVPYQDLPESDAKVRWLIPLGCVRWKPNQNLNQSGNFVKRSDDDLKASRKIRRYIGVVAESIQAADGILRMRDRTKDYSDVQSDDLVWVEGKLRVEGDARLFGGKLDFLDSHGLDQKIPLSIQRADMTGVSGSLQVVIGQTNNGANTFTVGPLKGKSFDAKLTVQDDGKVGIGTSTPADTLEVAGNLRVGKNPLRFTSSWSTFPDNATNQAEICNETKDFKTLMIVGNRSAGPERRVSVWDWLDVKGTLEVTGTARGGPWTGFSDVKLKKNIEPLTGALNKLLQLRGVCFEWREPEKMGNLSGTQMGLVAQEVEKVFPEWVGTGPDGYRELTIRGFEALTIEALRELKAEIESLRQKMEQKK
ncbi:MAG: tail fiber domain-containing protein [Methylococcales bacterium]|nr:tail fiber domain-containing protein [Methylococcales bacterium]